MTTCLDCEKKPYCKSLCEDMERLLPGENDGDVLDYDNANHTVLRFDTEDGLDHAIQENGIAEPQSLLCDQGDLSALETFGFTDFQKIVAHAKYFDGMSDYQVAIYLDISPDLVKKHVALIKAKVLEGFKKRAIWDQIKYLIWYDEYKEITGRYSVNKSAELREIAAMYYYDLNSQVQIAYQLGQDIRTIERKMKKIKKILENNGQNAGF